MADSNSVRSIDLSWSDNIEPDIAGYRIYRGIMAGFTLVSPISEVDLSMTSFSDIGLNPDTTYY